MPWMIYRITENFIEKDVIYQIVGLKKFIYQIWRRTQFHRITRWTLFETLEFLYNEQITLLD